MEWTDDTIGRLRTLWAEGHSTAEIGRRMGISKNAVVGKAHRLSLSARPSPIRRDGEKMNRRRQPRRTYGPTLPALSGFAPPQPAVEHPRQAAPQDRAASVALPGLAPPSLARPGLAPPDRAPPVLRAVSAPRPGGRVTPCCWPIGEPGTRSFRFCDAESLGGKPYCEQHAALAYVKARDRREDAA